MKNDVDVGNAESTGRREHGSDEVDWVVVRHWKTLTPGRINGVEQRGEVGGRSFIHSKHTGCRKLRQSVKFSEQG